MSKQIAIPENVKAMAAALAQSVAAAGSAGVGELYLKMTKFGEWVYGAESTELEEGATLALNPMGFQHGWVAWGSKARGNDGTNVGEVMVPGTQPMPAEADLPEVNGDWSKAVAMQFRVMDGEDEGLQLLWKANSIGGRKAYGAILQEVIGQIGAGKPYVALVKLAADSYPHKAYGKIFTPEINVVGWTDDSGEPPAAIEAKEPEAAQEPEEAESVEAEVVEEVVEEAPRRRRRRAS